MQKESGIMISRESLYETLGVVIYLHNQNGSAQLYMINNKMKIKGYTYKEISWMLRTLKKEGWIRFHGTMMSSFEPTETGIEEYKNFKPRARTVRMTPQLVKQAIDNYMKEKGVLPDISDIVDQFEKDFGIPEQESPKRLIRDMATKGMIKRSGNPSRPRYYTENETAVSRIESFVQTESDSSC